MKSVILSLAVALASAAPAMSVVVWGQCGGSGYGGSTVCDAGSTCVKVNDYYSQCQPSSATSTATAPTSSSSICSGTRTKFKFFGVNESGAEFGNTVIPGALGTDYTWPSPSSIDYFIGQGFNTFRVPFLMERVSPPSTGGLTGPFNQTYLSGLKDTVSYITGKGGYAAIDPHNFMIYNGATLTDTSAFQAWWQKLATEFKSNDHVIFDLQNEPHDIPAQTVFNLMQAGVNGVRAAGATSQLILVEGTSWTGAWTWTTSGNSNAFGAIKDPNNNVAIEMHQYLDSDGSGTSATCVSSTIGAERLQNATAWLKQNNLKGLLGEIGAGSNAACISAVQGALCEMQQSGVWLGALWWAAGPWWGTYYQSIEPPSGPAIASILPQALVPFL
ncbi:endoglucanase [Lentinus tigrinus ALCF2SS1-7]|uniref:cellulase n=1 Tax=Lentinus tigrinus ALCF2SS1-6 TaxID=1328759 RepID=A0A5C2RT57_9APHY|nr:endoglucanase [Lentinus tigrinus ALCF2SS1-6]RPD69892.1 endoglucanase [Lentinus tigrinus ALCF2SS1-7]